MIHIFHGFLGSPEDFSSFKREDIVLHDLYDMTSLSQVHPDDTLIGYSMGGRIALDIADACKFQIKKIVLINAHPGLQQESEKSQRESFEDTILKELGTRESEDFMKWWNALPLFKADRPITIEDERFQKSKDLFDKFRLSRQKNHLPEIVLNRHKVLFLAGQSDEKYMELTKNVLLPLGIHVKVLSGGHRLFQNPLELKRVLIEEGIL